MKTINELNPNNYPTTPITEKNLIVLFERVIELQDMCELDFVITSGLRSDQKQAQLIADGKTNAKFSKHVSGNACDIYDPRQELQKWCLDNIKALENIGLWCEDFSKTPNWVHVQTIAPLSGKRFFLP